MDIVGKGMRSCVFRAGEITYVQEEITLCTFSAREIVPTLLTGTAKIHFLCTLKKTWLKYQHKIDTH